MAVMPEPTPDPDKNKGSEASVQQAADAFRRGAEGAPRMDEDPENPQLFWNTVARNEPFTVGVVDPMGGTGSASGTKQVFVPEIITKNDAIRMFEGWTFEQKSWFRNGLAATGVDVSNTNDAALLAYWARYVERSAAKYDAGINMNPWALLDLDIQQRLKWQQQDQKKPQTITQTSEQVQLSTQMDARAIYTTAAKQLLGRDPTPDETDNFFTLLNAEEKANPQITSTTSTYNAEGKLTNQSSVQEGGLSAEARNLAAMDMAKQNPEYGAYQASTTYMDALKSMVYGRS